VAKSAIDQLLIRSALEPELCRRLGENPEEVFEEFDLTAEERELLRQPDHRLLPLLGVALAGQMKSSPPAAEAPALAGAHRTEVEARTLRDAVSSALPDTLLALTVLPCALHENGQLKGITYVLWANPLPAGADPASLPRPEGIVIPGQPLAPLHAVVRISAVQSQDAAGNPQLSMWGAFQPAPNASLPPPPESAGNIEESPFQSPVDSAPVKAAVAAVRQAASSERYDRLVDLLNALHRGDVR
jgi:hypothetical protein